MGKNIDHNIAAEKEFASLAQVLNQTADDAAKCLKVLKKNLSEYDSQHGNHLRNTSKSYMRSDIRNAKDVSTGLAHVAHQIHKSHKSSKAEVTSARNMMNATARSMDVLIVTARNYDEKNGRSTGVKGAIKNVVHGKNGAEKDDKGGLFGKSDENDNYGGHHDGGILHADSVEGLVKTTLRDNFNRNVLSYQINAAEKTLSPHSIINRAKEAVHDVKDKLTGGKSSPTYDGRHANNTATP